MASDNLRGSSAKYIGAKNTLRCQISIISGKARVAQQKIKSKMTRGSDRRVGCFKKRGRGLEPRTNEKQIYVAVRAGLELEASSRIPSLAPNRLATLLHLYLMVNQGSYRVLNSWKGSLNLPSNFPDLEKVWKNSKKS